MRPLSGIRILAFEQYGAGPFGTQHLGDLGAEVIKIEPAGTEGDYARGLGPYFVGDEPGRSSASLFFQSFNRNKKSITLDLTKDAGPDILARLVRTADATADNLRGDVPKKLGVTYDGLKEHNPAIVCAHCSAYGRDGPRAAWPGYDYLMQAEAGYFGLCGDPDGAPTRFGLSIVDYMAGQAMALGLVSAILSARATGVGRDVDVDLFSTAIFNLSYLGAWALNTDYAPGRQPRSAHPSLVPCQLYKTADGWIYLMCNKAGFWPVLCDLIDRPSFADDPRFATFPDRLRNRDVLTGLLDEALSANTTEYWLGVLHGKVPVAPVLTPAEALANPYVAERGLIQTLDLDSSGPFDVLASPIRAGGETDPDRPAPDLGGQTDEILEGLGYSKGEIAGFRKTQVI